jgi:hypothetical protein
LACKPLFHDFLNGVAHTFGWTLVQGVIDFFTYFASRPFGL